MDTWVKLEVALVDVDGTLCERSLDRENRAREAIARPAIVKLVRTLPWPICYVSARPISQLNDTCDWLSRHELPFGALYLRETDIEDVDFKRAIYAKIAENREVVLVLEDRQRCVDMWRSLGLTVLQTAPGDF